MSTKMGFWRWALATAAVVCMTGTADARRIQEPPIASTVDPAGIVMLPDLRVDEAIGLDTVVQMTNVSNLLIGVRCFYINANAHCTNAPATVCVLNADCDPPGACVQDWNETDFFFTLTKRQPISWSVDQGLPALPLAGGGGQQGQANMGSIPPVPENPFMGELRCIEVDLASGDPIDQNDLKAEATITRTAGPDIDVRKYNSINLRAIAGQVGGDPNVVNIGGPDAEYYGCPNILNLDHFFERANVVSHNGTLEGRVRSQLVLVPCEADYAAPEFGLTTITVQFLIYNEFEQRFSTSTKIRCFEKTFLSDIDTRPGPDGDAFSIFSVGTQGTLKGHSRLRSVTGPAAEPYDGRAIVGVLTEFWDAGVCRLPRAEEEPGGEGAQILLGPTILCDQDAECPGSQICSCSGDSPACTRTTAGNIQVQGSRPQGDQFILPGNFAQQQ